MGGFQESYRSYVNHALKDDDDMGKGDSGLPVRKKCQSYDYLPLEFREYLSKERILDQMLE